MADREVPRRVTQQQLEIAAPERVPEVLAVPLAPPVPGPSAAIPSSLPPAPSDLELRERQRRWLEERARFERARDSDDSSSSSK